MWCDSTNKIPKFDFHLSFFVFPISNQTVDIFLRKKIKQNQSTPWPKTLLLLSVRVIGRWVRGMISSSWTHPLHRFLMEQRQRQRQHLQHPTSTSKAIDPENVKVIEWEDYDQELARLWSLSSALSQANDKKQTLQQKLQSLIQVPSCWFIGNLLPFCQIQLSNY